MTPEEQNKLRHQLIDLYYKIDAAIKSGGPVQVKEDIFPVKTCACTENCFCMVRERTMITILLGE